MIRTRVPLFRTPCAAARQGLLALVATIILIAGCAGPLPSAPSRESSAAFPRDTESARLAQLMVASDEAFLARNPLDALRRGDLRYAAQFGEDLSDGYIAAELAAAEHDLQQLASIDRARLEPADQIAFDAFRSQRLMTLREMQPGLARLWSRLRLDHFNGWHIDFAELSSGSGIAPYRSVADYENGLARLDGFVAYLDLAVARCREGIAAGIVQPRFVVERMVQQFDRFIAYGVEQSPYYGPIRALPPDLPMADRDRLTRAYADAIRERLIPAFTRTREFLAGEYLRAARASVGLSQLPGGADYYRHLVELHTTTTMTPAEIHRLGLAEVARITGAMELIRQEVGYAGSLAQFLEHIRTDPRFKPASAEALGDGYRAIGQRVDAAMPRLFSRRPSARLEIRPTPDYQAPTGAAGTYSPIAPDGSRPGTFYYNTYDLASRTTSTMEALYLHEAEPGHHHESALRRENGSLPNLLRFNWITAYGEGWALYAESLGAALGLYTDPYQRFGWLTMDVLRAVRLVVDTGLHTMGWSREQAIEYMLAHSSLGRTDATAEVERYIVWPAQALSYKIGALTIARLRAAAESELGARFDIREFHDQVLDTGLLPMAVLESKLQRWIADRRQQ